MILKGRSRSWNRVSPGLGSTGKSSTDHFLGGVLGGRSVFVSVPGTETGGAETVIVCCFLLKSRFKNAKNFFNRHFLLWVKKYLSAEPIDF